MLSRISYPPFVNGAIPAYALLPRETHVGWTVAEGAGVTVATDTSVLYNGRPTVRVDIPAGFSGNVGIGVTSASITPPSGWLGERSGVIWRSGDVSRVTSVVQYLGDSGYTNYVLRSVGVPGGAQNDAWIAQSGSVWSVGAGSVNWAAAMQGRVRFIVAAGNAAPFSIWLTFWGRMPVTRGKVVTVWDDGCDEHYWYVAGLARGYRVPTAFAIPPGYLTGSAAFMTLANLRDLATNYNDIIALANHSMYNDNFDDQGLELYVSRVLQCRGILEANGVDPRSLKLHVYVQGRHDLTLQQRLYREGFVSAREVGSENRFVAPYHAAPGSPELMATPATVNLQDTTSLATAKQYLLNAAVQGGTAFIMGHIIGAAAAYLTWTYADVKELYRWLAEQRDLGVFDLVDWRDWVRDIITV